MIFNSRKSAEDILSILRILLERGCKELINAPDVLGNTPLHALIVRYALEEARYLLYKFYTICRKYWLKKLVLFLQF